MIKVWINSCIDNCCCKITFTFCCKIVNACTFLKMSLCATTAVCCLSKLLLQKLNFLGHIVNMTNRVSHWPRTYSISSVANIYHSFAFWKQYSTMYFVYPFEFSAVKNELIYPTLYPIVLSWYNLLTLIFLQDTSLLKHAKWMLCQ